MRFLVHSGGGSKGSYGAGIINYLMGDLKISYQGFCGVSVGAINSAFLAMFPAGQEQQAAHTLKEWWLRLDNHKIFRRWEPFGRIHAIWRQSFYDSTPLHTLIREQVNLDIIRNSGKKVSVGAVSVSSGKYLTFNQDDDDFISAVLASSAFPGMLSPIRMKDQLWIDGGCKELSPIRTAIEMGATEVDVITTSPEIRVKKFIENPSIVDIIKRAIDVSTDKILSNDIDRAIMHNKLVQAGVSDKKLVKLRILRPHHNLIDDVLDFRPEKIREMMEKGYEDAKAKYMP
jgi:NTE family protein